MPAPPTSSSGSLPVVLRPTAERRRSGPLTALVLVLALALAACGGSNTDAGSPPPGGTGASISALNGEVAATGQGTLTAVPKDQGKVNVYAKPGDTTPVDTKDNPWLYDNQPGAEVPLVFLVKGEAGDSYEVYLASRPNGSTGFVKKADVTTEANPYRIEVDSAGFNLKTYRGDEVVLDAPIAVGKSDAPTPGGLFYLNVLIEPPDKGGDYGPYAYGLSGYSEVLDTFNGGDGQLGIHGTNQPQLIGTEVSHGCIRLRNEDITTLAADLKLPLGTPVKILT